jgi:hypothetical protein
VFETQLAMFQSMAEMTQSLSGTYAKTLEDVWGLAATAKPDARPGAQAGRPEPPRADKPANAQPQTFALPEIPKSGQSWYKPPTENPVLVFWDEMLKPWRTMMPAGDQSAAMTMGPIAVFGMMSGPGLAGFPAPSGPFRIPDLGFPSAPSTSKNGPMTDVSESLKRALDEWSSVWQALLTPPGDTAAAKHEHSADAARSTGELDPVTESWKTLIAFHSDSGMAMARVFFPDHTVVTMKVPLPTMPFVPTSGMPNA